MKILLLRTFILGFVGAAILGAVSQRPDSGPPAPEKGGPPGSTTAPGKTWDDPPPRPYFGVHNVGPASQYVDHPGTMLKGPVVGGGDFQILLWNTGKTGQTTPTRYQSFGPFTFNGHRPTRDHFRTGIYLVTLRDVGGEVQPFVTQAVAGQPHPYLQHGQSPAIGMAQVYFRNETEKGNWYGIYLQEGSIPSVLVPCSSHDRSIGPASLHVDQPGWVAPGPRVMPGKYNVLAWSTGKNGLDRPNAYKSFGPYELKGGRKYLVRVRDDGELRIGWLPDDALVMPYTNPDAGSAVVYYRNDTSREIWYGLCLQDLTGTLFAPPCTSYQLRLGPVSLHRDQPGSVSAGPRVTAGKFNVLIWRLGKDGTQPPADLRSFGPFDFKEEQKYLVAIREDAGAAQVTVRADDLSLQMYSRPPRNNAVVYYRNDSSPELWYGVCLQDVSERPVIPPCTSHDRSIPPTATRPSDQPGQVHPGPRVSQGKYSILVWRTGKQGLDKPTSYKTFGPYDLKGGAKYLAALREDPAAGLLLDVKADDVGLQMYSKPAGGYTTIYYRNDTNQGQWYGYCLQGVSGSVEPPELTGRWSGTLTVLDLSPELTKQPKTKTKPEGCAFELDLARLKGKAFPFEMDVSAQADGRATLSMRVANPDNPKDAPSKSEPIPFHYSQGKLTVDQAIKGTSVLHMEADVTRTATGFALEGPWRISLREMGREAAWFRGNWKAVKPR